MAKEHYCVAVDGPSGAGKSSLAKQAAEELGILYVDTGAIYRSIGYAAFSRGIAKEDAGAIVALLPELKIEMAYAADGLQHMYLNGADVTKEIRLPEISLYASAASAIPEVRAYLLDMQRNLAKKQSVIMDGRDIGTVILPDADVKIYLTAAAETRAKRRFLELQERGTPRPYEEVLREVNERDYNDTHRAVAPLRQAEDAVLLDTSELNLEQSLQALLTLIRKGIG